MASRLKAILTNDANFFKKVRLMDYSLLVMKIYWKQYAKDNGIQDISLVILNTTQYFRLKTDSQIRFIPFLPHRRMEFLTI